MKKLIIFSISLFLLIASCTKQVDYKLKQQEVYPIAYSFLTPDSITSCYLWYSDVVLKNNFSPNNSINNAQVFIYENGLIFDTLLQQNGAYYKGHSYPKMGASYSLKILVDNKELTATTSIPYKTKLDNASFQWNVEYLPKPQVYIPQQIIYLNDTSLINNMFEVFFFGYGHDPNDSINLLVSYDYNGLIFGEMDYKIKEDVQIQYNPTSLLFTDKYFNGQQTKIVVNSTFIGESTCLRTLSKEYYQYKQSFYAHQYSINLYNDGGQGLVEQVLFSSEPNKMYSNIKGGGYGVFAGFSQDTVKTIYK